MRNRRGFTLIEVLVVVAIIALLISVLMPSLSKAREQSRRVVCTSNVHQIMLAANMYAMEHPRGEFLVEYPVPGLGDTTDELGFLYPRFLRTFNVAVCPGTKNVVKSRLHLENNALNREDAAGGHSYESRAWMWGKHIFNGKAIAMDQVFDPAQNKFVEASPRKSTKNVSRPAQVCLLMDADDEPSPNPWGQVNNWPDKGDNHGPAGTNVGYCDGHALWTPTGRRLMSAYLSGYYNPNLPSNLYQKYGVTRTESNGWIEFKW